VNASDPAILGDKEVIVQDQATDKSYTPRDYRQLLADAGLQQACEIADYYIGFVKFADPASFPNVDVYAEKGSGIDTVVGVQLPNLQLGNILSDQTVYFKLPGDGSQEDITNSAVMAWQNMVGHHFEMHDNPGVEHGALMTNPEVLGRLLAHLKQPAAVHHPQSAVMPAGTLL
jgi:lecithin-cholesterol acyltransferase